jgi:hypothetical protein
MLVAGHRDAEALDARGSGERVDQRLLRACRRRRPEGIGETVDGVQRRLLEIVLAGARDDGRTAREVEEVRQRGCRRFHGRLLRGRLRERRGASLAGHQRDGTEQQDGAAAHGR